MLLQTLPFLSTIVVSSWCFRRVEAFPNNSAHIHTRIPWCVTYSATLLLFHKLLSRCLSFISIYVYTPDRCCSLPSYLMRIVGTINIENRNNEYTWKIANNFSFVFLFISLSDDISYKFDVYTPLIDSMS